MKSSVLCAAVLLPLFAAPAAAGMHETPPQALAMEDRRTAPESGAKNRKYPPPQPCYEGAGTPPEKTTRPPSRPPDISQDARNLKRGHVYHPPPCDRRQEEPPGRPQNDLPGGG